MANSVNRHRPWPPHGTPQLHALTTPLITTSSGEKMGKTRERRGLA